MSAQEKAVGGCHTTTTVIEKTHANVAASCKKRHTALKRCDRILSGAENTSSVAANLPVSEIFSRPEFNGFGRGVAYPQGWRHDYGHVFTPTSILSAGKARRMVFVTPVGAKTMTLTTPKMGNTSPLARQQAIENALSTALYFVRLPSTDSGLKAATSRAIRAASMLKQACADLSIGRAA